MKLNEVTGEDTSEQPEQLTPAYEDTQEIKASVFPLLRAKIDKLNRKAARLHVPPIELTVEKEIYKEFKADYLSPRKVSIIRLPADKFRVKGELK